MFAVGSTVGVLEIGVSDSGCSQFMVSADNPVFQVSPLVKENARAFFLNVMVLYEFSATREPKEGHLDRRQAVMLEPNPDMILKCIL